MAEESLISSLYPPPPPYYKFFTDDNLQKFKQLKSSSSNEEEIEFTEENKDLQYLVPPKPPSGETYRSFGNIWHVSSINYINLTS